MEGVTLLLLLHFPPNLPPKSRGCQRSPAKRAEEEKAWFPRIFVRLRTSAKPHEGGNGAVAPLRTLPGKFHHERGRHISDDLDRHLFDFRTGVFEKRPVGEYSVGFGGHKVAAFDLVSYLLIFADSFSSFQFAAAAFERLPVHRPGSALVNRAGALLVSANPASISCGMTAACPWRNSRFIDRWRNPRFGAGQILRSPMENSRAQGG